VSLRGQLTTLVAARTALEAQIASTREERDAMSDCEADGVAALHEKVCSCLLTYCKPRSYGNSITYLLTYEYLLTNVLIFLALLIPYLHYLLTYLLTYIYLARSSGVSHRVAGKRAPERGNGPRRGARPRDRDGRAA
jgi:hypothetical protein